MKAWKKVWICIAALVIMCLPGLTAAAESGDNSLYSLGLEVGECSPEFYYSTLEYTITVPAGTTELTLNPVTSDANATIVDISGTTLDENSNGTVFITVEAPNGAQVTYTLNVVSDGAAAPQEETEPPQTEKSAEQLAQEELQRQQESEEAALREAEMNTVRQQVNELNTKNQDLTDRLNLLMKILYGLIGFAVVLLFLVINQCLRNKDLKDDLKEAKSQAEANNEFARKEQGMQNNYYYTPHQNMQANMPVNMQPGIQQPVTEATQNVQAAFGNAPQTVYSQPAPGQVTAPKSEPAPQPQERPQPAPQEIPAQPQMVQGKAEEPDVNVEMIDL